LSTPTDIHSQLIRDEGDAEFPYVDTAGKQTIGIGHNLTDKGLSTVIRQLIYQEDFREADDALRMRLPWFAALNDARQGVLLNMCFNMGFSKLEEFTKFLQAAAQGDWETAADEMRDSLWAKEVGDRAVRLEQQMRTGAWV
jgi:GH24 family phage-related lysozyme (muramidase)